MADLRIYLIGSFRVENHGGVVSGFESDKVRALLAYLVIEADRSHYRSELAGLFWPEIPERRARQNLSQALSNLRKVIGDRVTSPPYLLITRTTLQWNPDCESWIDLHAFDQVYRGIQTHAHPDLINCDICIESLARGSSLYRGAFLEGFSLSGCVEYEHWLLIQREHIHRRFIHIFQSLVTGHHERGSYDLALQYAWKLVELDRWREESHRSLMRLLALTGQRSAALAQYETCRQIVLEAFGVEPSQETQHLVEQIRTHADSFVSMPDVDTKPISNLPILTTPFIGRKTELESIQSLLGCSDCRMITLLGPGGCGKTRLAIETGHRQLKNFEYGVFFVSLAPIYEVEVIPAAIAEAIGFSFYEGERPWQQLLNYLRHKEMLLILDNFEHLLPGSELAAEILKTASKVKILFTSRVRLNLGGEVRFPVGGMQFPETPVASPSVGLKYNAIQLFLDAARRAQPGFELTMENLEGVIQICRLVDGIPLGIRLAAAWVVMLTPDEIAEEITRNLDFLKSDRRDAPARQLSIRAAFDHSWNLLTAQEQEVYPRLSVFRGGFSRQAAQEVAGASLQLLRTLVDKSMLNCDASGRYEMHELLRQYAKDLLDLDPDAKTRVRDHHTAYYTAALQGWLADLKGSHQQTTLVELDLEIKNARKAWEWAVENEILESMDKTMDGLGFFYDWRGRHGEGEAIFRQATEKLATRNCTESVRVLAKTLAWQGHFCLELLQEDLAAKLLWTSLALLGEAAPDDQELLPFVANHKTIPPKEDTHLERGFAWMRLGWLFLFLNLEQSNQCFEKSYLLLRDLDDLWWKAKALFHVGDIACEMTQFSKATKWLRKSLEIRRGLGDQKGIADSLRILGVLAWKQAKLEESVGLQQESLAAYQESGNRFDIAAGYFQLGESYERLGEFVKAHSLMDSGWKIYEDIGLTYHHNLVLYNMVYCETKIHLGEYQQVLDICQKRIIRYHTCDFGWCHNFASFVMGMAALSAGTLAEAQEHLMKSSTNFREYGHLEALCEALAVLGYVEFRQNQPQKAIQRLREAMEIVVEYKIFISLLYGLPTLALLLAEHGKYERALEIHALAWRYGFVANSRWFEEVAGERLTVLAKSLPAQTAEAAKIRGRSLDLWETAQALKYELESLA